jgi:uncharacterized protein (TIGR02588 family)
MPQTGQRGSKGESGGKSRAGRHKPSRVSAIEWVLGALSAAMVVAIIGFLLYQALAVSVRPPQFDVVAGKTERRGDAYYVAFQVFNRGGATVADVTVEGQLMDGDRSLETGETVLDYLPGQSERQGALVFRNDPGRHRLLLGVRGYREP